MADVAHRVEPAHVLLLEEIDRVAVAFGEQRDEHVGAGHGVLAARLDVEDRALDHSLEAGGRLRIGLFGRLQLLILLVEVAPDDFAEFGQVDTAGEHHLRCVLVVDQREQQVLERRVFVPPLGRARERGVEGLFEVLGETGHSGIFLGGEYASADAEVCAIVVSGAFTPWCRGAMSGDIHRYSKRPGECEGRRRHDEGFPNSESAASRCAAALSR